MVAVWYIIVVHWEFRMAFISYIQIYDNVENAVYCLFYGFERADNEI